MKIVSYQIGSGVVSPDDIIAPFKVKVQMGDSQFVSKSGSYVIFYLGIGDGDNIAEIAIHEPDMPSFSISKGGTKTFSFSEAQIASADQDLMNRILEATGDNGASRKYPAQLRVVVGEVDDDGNLIKVYDASKKNACSFLTHRLNPEVSECKYTDLTIGSNDKSALEYFGCYVRGKSNPVLTFDWSIDALDVTLTAITSFTLTDPNGVSFQSFKSVAAQTEHHVIQLAVPQYAGVYKWTFEVTDSAGNSTVRSGEYNVLDYVDPSIDIFDIDRYIVTQNEKGEDVYTEARDGEGGERVWTDIRVNAYKFPDGINGNNTRLYLVSGAAGGTDDIDLIYEFSNGVDSGDLNLINDMNVYNGVVNEASEYYFTLKVCDFFHGLQDTSVQKLVIVKPASADFNIESFGVAVGMYSTGANTGDDKHKLFEVAKSHGVKIYGEIEQIGDLPSTWIPLSSSLLNGTTPGTYGGPLRCRAFGDKRIIDGSVSIKPGSETVDIAMLPDGFAPEYDKFMMAACQAANTGAGNIARIVVAGKTNQSNPDDVGKLRLSWIKRMATGEDVTSGQHWVDCSMEYWVN